MPKMKTNKSMKKRFSLTKKGKIKFKKAGARHLKSNKSGKQVRQKRNKKVMEATTAEVKRIKRALGK